MAEAAKDVDLVKALNRDLEREFQAIIRYVQFAASVHGPMRHEVSQLFLGEIQDELGHARFLADKVAALGGTPTTSVAAVPAMNDPEGMLQMVVEAEQQDVRQYGERARQAAQAGDLGLKVQLENIVLDETRHLEETRKVLDGWH